MTRCQGSPTSETYVIKPRVQVKTKHTIREKVDEPNSTNVIELMGASYIAIRLVDTLDLTSGEMVGMWAIAPSNMSVSDYAIARPVVMGRFM